MAAAVLVAASWAFFPLVSAVTPFSVENTYFLHLRIDIAYANVSDGNLGLSYRDGLRKRDDCPVTEAKNCPGMSRYTPY